MMFLPSSSSATGLLALLSLSSMVRYALGGDPCKTVTTDEKLTGNVVCECGDRDVPSVIDVVGPATLNLNGFQVKCKAGGQPEHGIVRLMGEGAGLVKGTVNGRNSLGGACVSFAGMGGHKMQGMTLKSCEGACVSTEASSHNNKILHNFMKNCGAQGMELNGDSNRVQGNKIRTAEGSCIEVNGNSNKLMLNMMNGCSLDGIEIDGDDTLVRHNIIKGADEDGIDSDGNHTVIKSNIIRDAGENGVWLDGSANSVVKDNKIRDSGLVGILVDTSNNRIVGNRITDGDAEAIQISSGAGGNTLRKNRAKDNDGDFDFVDDNMDCGTNDWKKNKGEGNLDCN